MRLRTLPVALSVSCLLVATQCSRSRAPPGASSSDGAEPHSTSAARAEADFDSAVELGRHWYELSEFDSVHAVLDPALQRARARHDSAAEARILTVLGSTAYRLGSLTEAKRLGETALRLKLATGSTGELHHSYNALALVAWDQSRLSDALDLLEKALEATPDSDRARSQAVVSNNRGLILVDLGRFREAQEAFESAREIFRTLGDARREGFALDNLGMLRIWRGTPADAVPVLRDAIARYASVDFHYGRVHALGQLGTAHVALGRIGEGIAALDSALAIARVQEWRDEEASNLEAMAEAFRVAGDYRRALELYREAEAINAEIGLVQETGTDQRSRAEIYMALGELGLAQEHAARALETHRSVEARWEEFGDLVLLADLAHQDGDRTSAARHLRDARKLAVQFDARTARLDVALAAARISDREGESAQVLRVLNEAESDFAQGGYDAEWEAYMLRARAHHRLGRLDSARVTGHRAVRAVERVRTGFGSGLLRTAYMAHRLEAYATLVSVLLDDGDVEAAFETADAARGRALQEHRAAGGSSEANGTGAVRGEEVLLQIGKLMERLRIFDAVPATERDSTALKDLQGQLAHARSEYEGLHLREAERHAGANASAMLATTKAGDVQRALRPSEALIEYFVTPDRLIGFVVSPHRIVSFASAVSADDVSRQVRVARDLVTDPEASTDAAAALLAALHGALIAPARDHLADAEHVVVVPHGVLNYLPFAALVDESTGRYLAEDHVIRVLPSAAALVVLRERGTGRSVNAVRVEALAPLPDQLPATRVEVRAVRRAMRDGRSVEGRRATEHRLRRALAEPGVVHVATHGVMNPRNPMFSRIELAAGGTETADDGRLEVHELLDLEVRSSLVFLSGCETALGTQWSTQFARGEDYATLAQAFLYAGAANVIATLWRVEDEGAAAFAGHFYSVLAESGPAGALAHAQRAMLTDPRHNSPYNWAAYQLAGAGLIAADTQETADPSVR